ncbi:hypothetical protein AALO_G00264860, partial [Alosa alosa]
MPILAPPLTSYFMPFPSAPTLPSPNPPFISGPFRLISGAENFGPFMSRPGASTFISGVLKLTFISCLSRLELLTPDLSFGPFPLGDPMSSSTSGKCSFPNNGFFTLGPLICRSGDSASNSRSCALRLMSAPLFFPFPFTLGNLNFPFFPFRLMSTSGAAALASTSGRSNLGLFPPIWNLGFLTFGALIFASGLSTVMSGPAMPMLGSGRSISGPCTFGDFIPKLGPLNFGNLTSGLSKLGPLISKSGPSIFPSVPIFGTDTSMSPFPFGPLRLMSTSGIETFGVEIDGILNLGPLMLPSGPSILGPSMSIFGALMPPSIFGTDISKSPFTLGPFRLKSTSGIEIFGPEMDGILNLGPLIFPSGPSMSISGRVMLTSGAFRSISALGKFTSISPPSTFGPLNPNEGILIFGILNPPSAPSISTSGPSMSTFGILISPSNFGTEMSLSPFIFGPFRLKSTSGIESDGPDIVGILNFVPLIFPSGPSMSTSGAFPSISTLGRFISTLGPSTFGPLNPNDGIFIFGILNPPSGPSISTSGPSMLTFGALISPSTLGPEISKSPFTFGPFRLKSISGIEIFGPDIVGILNLCPLIFPSGPSISRSGVSISTFGALRSISPFGIFKSTSGPSTLGPLNPNEGIFIFGILNPPSGPSMSTSGPSMSTFGPLMSPSIFGTETSISPLTFGPFRLKSTSGIEIFGPDIVGILILGPLIFPPGPSMSRSGVSMSTFGALRSIFPFGIFKSTSGPSTLGPLNPNEGILIFGMWNPPSGPSMSTSGPSMLTFGPLMSPSIFGTETSISPLTFGPFRLKSISGIEIFGPDIVGILNLGPLIFPSGPSMSRSGVSMSTFGVLRSIFPFGIFKSTSGPSTLGPLNPNEGIFIFGILNPPSGPSMSTSGPSMSMFGPLRPPSIFGTETSISPLNFGPFRLKSTSGIEIFGPDIVGILNLGPLIFPSGPSMSRCGVSISTFGALRLISPFGIFKSTSGPSTLGPLNPNEGIFIFGILNPPSGPSMSRSGPSMSIFGPLMSPSIFGTETSTSPFNFGPFRLKSISGIEIFGPDIVGILNLGPLIFPSGPSMSRSGVSMSTFGVLRSIFPFGIFKSTSGPSTLGPLNPNEGIFIFGILNPPSGPSMSTSGPSMSIFGPLRPPSIFGTETSISPLNL